MVDFEIQSRLMSAFPRSHINYEGEVILHEFANQYFILRNCETELDVKCKVLEWCSRGAYKTEPYSTKKANEKLHKFMLTGINKFLGTKFTESDMEIIYTYLGNAIRHDKTVEFVQAGYNMDFFKQFKGG